MTEYIEREALLKTHPFTKCGGKLNAYNDGYLDCAEDARESVRKAPAADVVEVDTVRAWLYEMAMNNTDNYLRYACEEVISRLDGLKEFAKDGRKRG